MLTFIIHLRKDTEERALNVNTIIKHYRDTIPNCKFIIVEDDKVFNFEYLVKLSNVHYMQLYNEGSHKKCEGYNLGLKHADTEIVCFLDIDCITSKENIYKAIDTVKSSRGICIGYNGVCVYFSYKAKKLVNAANEDLYDFFDKLVDKDNLVLNYTTENYHIANTKAVGGVLYGYKETFKQIGGFNNNFKGWGYEDNEIILRSSRLEVPVFYINTKKPLLFHLPHKDLEANEKDHGNYRLNEQEYLRIASFNKQQMLEYIKKW